MEQAINCLKENCNGILGEGVRGFYKCTVCGAKVKKSLVQQKSVPTVTTIQQPIVTTVQLPIGVPTELTPPPVAMTSVFPLAETQQPAEMQQAINQAISMVAQVSKDITDTAKNKIKDAPKVAKTTTQKLITNDGIQLVGKTLTIKCMDCGGERVIKVQDAFQVKRCVECQKTYSKARRAEKAKAKRSAVPTLPTI